MATPAAGVVPGRRASSSDAFLTRHNRPATIEEGAFVPLDDLLRETFLSVRCGAPFGAAQRIFSRNHATAAA